MGKVRNNSIDGTYFTSAQRQSSWTSLLNWIRDATVDKIRMTQYTRTSLAAVSMSLCNHDACLEHERAVGTNWIEIHCNSNLKWLFWSFKFAVELIENQRCRSNSQLQKGKPNHLLLDGTCLLDCFARVCLGINTSIASKVASSLWVWCLGLTMD